MTPLEQVLWAALHTLGTVSVAWIIYLYGYWRGQRASFLADADWGDES